MRNTHKWKIRREVAWHRAFIWQVYRDGTPWARFDTWRDAMDYVLLGESLSEVPC